MKNSLFGCMLWGLLAFIPAAVSAQADSSGCQRYIRVPAGYLMVLRQGDNVFSQLELLAAQEKIPAATLTGMGFAEVEFGFFNSRTKKYRSRKYKAGELACMNGSIAWKNGKPSVHAHGMLTNKRFKSRGGHILSATVGTGSLEIMVTVHDQVLERKKDEGISADILFLGGCRQ